MLPTGTAMSNEATTHGVVLPMFSPAAQQPTKRYRTIVADPPWRYELRVKDETHRARSPYGTMSTEEILGLPVGVWAQEDSHLYLWVTNAFMAEGLEIVKAWGFQFKTIITWIKGRFEGPRLVHHIGTGNYYRNSTEHILFAIRGSLPTLNHDSPTALIAPRGEHSEKPAAFYDMVQHMSPGPYLDVFARKQRFQWDTWGDEAFDFRTDGIWHQDAGLDGGGSGDGQESAPGDGSGGAPDGGVVLAGQSAGQAAGSLRHDGPRTLGSRTGTAARQRASRRGE
jgi:N6-adenosine-specific RNA methylase IME4